MPLMTHQMRSDADTALSPSAAVVVRNDTAVNSIAQELVCGSKIKIRLI